MNPIFPTRTVVLLVAALISPALAHPGHGEEAAAQPGERRGPGAMQAIELPVTQVSITIEGDSRVIRANGLPEHETGAFPNAGNPNALRPQEHEYRVPLKPTINAEPRRAGPEFGIALNGVIFDAGTGEFWSPNGRTFGRGEWNYEALGGGINLGLDANNAHVQPTGKYHYHGVPTGLTEGAGDGMVHIGWAADGFPMYAERGHQDPNDADSPVVDLRSSYHLKQGTRPASPSGPGGAYDGTFTLDYEYVEGSGDLDECNGRFGVTPEFPEGTYYYVVTEEFPNVPRYWRGTPDQSWMNRRGGQRGGEGEPRERRGRRPRR
ncbi:MAG: YHYH protein [Planctomycetota bacterium]